MAADVVGYTRLMGVDEEGTLDALKRHRAELVEPAVSEHRGRIVKLMGDGILVEFASAVEAVACAADIQQAMPARNDGLEADRRIALRIGINVGDIIVEDDDIYGDGVNLAARIEGEADPGGICLSDDAYRQVHGKVDCTFEDLGEHHLKNIAEPVRIYAVRNVGATGEKIGTSAAQDAPEQEVRFCTTPDGVQIAYAVVGHGPPLVKTANWLNHLEHDWESLVWRHLLHGLSRGHTLIRYDERGNGLSDWDVDEISFDAFVQDLETVVDAAGIDRFPLLGISQGCAVSIAYAVRHPERVSHLVLYGGFAQGRRMRGSQDEIEQAQALVTLIRQGWGADNPAFRQFFTSRYIPDATAEQMQYFNDLQRITASPENAVRLREAFDVIEVSALLPQVAVPTLVLHCRDDAAAPFEEGRRMAAMIPGARFVALDGRNHLILEHEPTWPRFLTEVTKFLAG